MTSRQVGPLDSYLRRYGRLPCETDPYLDSSSGGDPDYRLIFPQVHLARTPW